MLTDAIRKGFSAGSDRLSSVSGVNLLAPPNASAEGGATNVTGGVLETDSATFRASKTLQEEVFGPLCVVVKCSSAQDLHDTVLTLEGQLTASVFHAGGPDLHLGSNAYATPTLAGEIRALKDLHDQGVLDSDEFKSAKAGVLDRYRAQGPS
jgi:hypothetical protein